MNRKKWLCVLLSLTMAFSLMPTAAFAAETETGQDSTAAAAESVQEAEEPPADKQEEAAPVETPVREQEDEDTEADPAQAEEEAALPATEDPTGPADRDPAVPATEPEEAGETEEAGEADTEAAALAEGDDTASEVDRTVLQETISRAQALVQEDYTEESWKVFADALAAAQTTAEKAEAAQEEIDAAAKALEQAMADLKEEDLKGSGYVLMNIPYGKFYESEGCGGVDAVSSATKSKPRNGGLTAGSYHVSCGGDDISGIIYPVYVEDLSVLKDNRRITDRDSITITTTARGRTSTATYNGREALFESESYSFYLLGKDSQPAGYKKLSGSNGSYSFGASTGSVSSSEGVTGSVSLNARHADTEIVLSGLQVEAGAPVSGVVLTTEDGSQYGLRHVVNLWRSTQIGWNNSDSGFEDIGRKTITNVRYYMPDGTITDYPVRIALAVGQYNELVDDHRIIRDDNDTEELFAAYLAAVSQVVVNGTAYDAAGDNAVRILDPATGELLLNAADRQAFPGLAENEVTLKADGYPDYSFRLVQPEITAGMHGQWTKGSKETLSFTSNAKFDYLREVRVDDAAIDPAHYTAAEGSTVIDLTPEYLETLAAGAHTIGIVSANGIASTDFAIVPAEEEEPAEDQKKEEQTSDPEKDDTDSKPGTSVSTKDSKGSGSSGTSGRRSSARSGRSSGSSHTGSAKARTGDTANTGLWLLLICAAGAGMAVLLLRRRNRKN